MNNQIVEIIGSFSLDDYRPIFPRDLDLGEPLMPRAGNLVTVIAGMRRSGKTYRMLQVMDQLMALGVSRERILYFSFEDTRIDPVTPETGDQVIETFYSLNPDALEGGAYFFFDEIQEMDNWGKWLRRVVDTMKATIYVTGSSSKLLSEEITSAFRGRSIEYVQYPFSFREFVRYRDPELIKPSHVHSMQSRLTLEGLFDEYLLVGGFPAVQDMPEPRRINLLQGYVQQVVSKDVVERHNISNPDAVVQFTRKALASNGRAFSLRKTANQMTSAGIRVGRNSLSDYLKYLKNAFLITGIDEFSLSLNERASAIEKVYAVDPGLARANAPASVRDDGQALEGAVAIELERRAGAGSRAGRLSLLKTARHGYEVDFVEGDALFGEVYQLIQVSNSIEDEGTRARETRALWEGMEQFGLSTSTLIVGKGKDAMLEQDGAKIEVVPAWKWFLS